jgi:ABC-type uncharacterized transport system fused permease/ATPase subunit
MISGSSGAGKSSLLRGLMGLWTVSAGGNLSEGLNDFFVVPQVRHLPSSFSLPPLVVAHPLITQETYLPYGNLLQQNYLSLQISKLPGSTT